MKRTLSEFRLTPLIDRFWRAGAWGVFYPLLTLRLHVDDLVAPGAVDARIARLGEIKEDLEAAMAAVQGLQNEAQERKNEADELRAVVTKLQDDKDAAESLLSVPEDAFVRLVGRATAAGRSRGLIEGGIVGLITGVASSLVAWYLITVFAGTPPTTLPDPKPSPPRGIAMIGMRVLGPERACRPKCAAVHLQKQGLLADAEVDGILLAVVMS